MQEAETKVRRIFLYKGAKEMILKAKRILNKNINKIKVPSEFIENPPKPEKVIAKTAKFFEAGEIEKIYIDDEFNLLDGYCSYLIAKEVGTHFVKIKQIGGAGDGN